MNTGLDISMLGSPGVTLAGDPVTGFVSAKSQALVFYLAATGETHRRGHLAGLLWSDVEEARARKNLRDVLSNLRRILGPALAITRQEVALVAGIPVVVDTSLFEAAARAGGPESLARAASLYRGEFLAGFYLSGAPLFEEWALGQREHYRLMALQVLSELTTVYVAQGQSLRAIDTLTQLLAADPWREEGYRQLMTLLADTGDTSAAITQYQRLRSVLADELGVEPDHETQALYEQIRRGRRSAAMAAGISTESAPSVVASVASNVPARTHPFVGRGQAVDRVLAAIGDPGCRLLTVVGQGGIGKTELALHCLRQVLAGPQAGQFRDGVFVVSLHTVDGASQPIQLATAIGDALGLAASEPVPVEKLVLDYLRPRRIMLLLDSFEHLLAARQFVAETLAAAAGLMILVTSRRKLGIPGEHLVTLQGLPVPLQTSAAAPLLDFAAMQLFQQQASAVAPDFTLNAANGAAVARICRSVDGLPLGVILAASLVRYLSVEEIARELEQDVRFVDEGAGGGQRGLRTVFERSWQLLEPEARQSLVRLTTFRGGFTRDAAATLAGASLSTLAALMDASFLRRVAGVTADVSRYEVIEVLRAFVSEQVSAAEAEQLRNDHSRYFLAWLDELADALQGRGQRSAVDAITGDLDNVRAAWDRAVAQRDVETLDRAALGLFRYYEMRSQFREGAQRFLAAAEALATSPTSGTSELTRTRLSARGGWFAFQLGRQEEALAWLKQGVALFRDKKHRQELLFCLNYLAAVMSYAGEYVSARTYCEAALRLARQCGEVHGVVVAQNILSQIAYAEGEFDAARRFAQVSLALDRERANGWSAAFSLVNVGRAMLALDEFGGAVACFEEAARIRRAIGDSRGMGHCLNLLGDVAAVQGDTVAAQQRYGEALLLFEEISNLQGGGESLLRLGRVALAVNELADAERYLLRALRRASVVDAVPLQLAVLAELAVLRLRQEDPAAADLSRLVLAHPAAGGVSRARLERFSGVSMPGDGIGFHTAALHTAVTALLSAVDPAAIAAEI